MYKQFIIIFLLIGKITFAQDFSIDINTGFAGFGNPFDGYYLSSSLKLPVFKGCQLSPRFMFVSNMNNNNIKYYFNKRDNVQSILFTKKINNVSETASLLELFIFLKPFEFFKNKKTSTIDLGIGAGYGFSIYAQHYYSVSNDDIMSVIIENGIRKSFSVSMYYNYHFKKFYLGINIGANDFFQGEGVSNIGLQIGINTH